MKLTSLEPVTRTCHVKFSLVNVSDGAPKAIEACAIEQSRIRTHRIAKRLEVADKKEEEQFLSKI